MILEKARVHFVWIFQVLIITHHQSPHIFPLWRNLNVLYFKPRICCPYLGKVGQNPRISIGLAGLSRQPVATAFCLCRWKNRNIYTVFMDPITQRETIYKHFFRSSMCIPASNQVYKSYGSAIFSFFRCGEVDFLQLSIDSTLTSCARNIAAEGYLIHGWETCQGRFDKATDSNSTGTLHFPRPSLTVVLPLSAWLRDRFLAANKHKWLSLFLPVLMRCCKGATYRVARVNWAVIARSWNASMWADHWSLCALTAMFS